MSAVSSPSGRNPGIALFRMLLCFAVVVMHLADHTGLPGLLLIYQIEISAVPFFMTLSFFLMSGFFHRLTPTGLKKRVWRLAWPHIFWAVVYWLVYTGVTLVSGKVWVEGVSPLLWQLGTGHAPELNPSMWYQVSLLALTLLFALVFSLLPRRAAQGTLTILGAVALALQYTGGNLALFGGLRYELAYPLGRMVEMLPHAVLGYLLGCAGEYIRSRPRLVWAGLGIPLAYRLRILLPHPEGFGYSGVSLLLSSLALVVFACQLPIRPDGKAAGVIGVISRYTLGIYCIHRMVGRFLAAILTAVGLPGNSVPGCLLVYLLCYLACWVMASLPLPQCRALVD